MAARAVVIVEDDVDELELFYAAYRLREAGLEVVLASHSVEGRYLVLGPGGRPVPERRRVKGKRGIEFEVDVDYDSVLASGWDVLVIPGGRSPERARLHRGAVKIARRSVVEGKPVIAICHGPLLLASAGVLRGRRVTGHPGIADDLRNAGAVYTGAPAERDGSLVTARHTTTVHEGFRLFMEVLREAGYV